MSIEVQYTIVCAILLAATIWGGIVMYRTLHGKKSGCCGCGLKDSCAGKKCMEQKKKEASCRKGRS